MTAIAVYTAIFGGYDEIPQIVEPDPAISYILFADSTIRSVPPPWELRPLPAIFVDPQRDARRVKVLPHIFLSDITAVVVWIDANTRIRRLSATNIQDLLKQSDFAIPPHKERDCIFEEARALMSAEIYDSAARISRQMSSYEQAGFPEHAGLHHSNFLIRRHLNPSCILFGNEWWQEISRHSKRDQLSFDFVHWKLPQVSVRTLPISYEDNQWFCCTGTHKLPLRIVSEHMSAEVRKSDLEHQFSASPYLPQYDSWPRSFLEHLRQINKIVAASGEPLVGNLCYFHNQVDFLYSPPDPRRGTRREIFLRTLAGRSRILQFGFNAGHSALTALTHSKATVTAVDNGAHPYTEAAVGYLSKAFPDRFQFIKINPRLLSVQEIDRGNYDMIHIDGGNDMEVFACHIAMAIAGSRPGTSIMIDDICRTGIRQLTNRLVADKLLAPYGDLENLESAAYIVLENEGRHQATFYDSLALTLLESTGELLRPSQEIHSQFMSDLLQQLAPTEPSAGPVKATAMPPILVTAPARVLDPELMDQIHQIGVHPWMLFRNAIDPSQTRFLVCQTQNDTQDFAKSFASLTAFGQSNLLRGLLSAMQLDIGQAVELLYSWSVERATRRPEHIYIGLPRGIDLPPYYNYPIFEIAGRTTAEDTTMRPGLLLRLLETYELTQGNDDSRLALVESLAIAVVRHMQQREQFDQAANIIARVLSNNPASRHLKVAINMLDASSRNASSKTQLNCI